MAETGKLKRFLKKLPFAVKFVFFFLIVILCVIIYKAIIPREVQQTGTKGVAKIGTPSQMTPANSAKSDISSQEDKKIYNLEREDKIEKAKTTKSSFVDNITAENEININHKLNQEEKRLSREARIADKSGDKVAKKNISEQRNQIRKDRENLLSVKSRRVEQTATPKPKRANDGVTGFMFDEAEFMKGELGKAKGQYTQLDSIQEITQLQDKQLYIAEQSVGSTIVHSASKGSSTGVQTDVNGNEGRTTYNRFVNGSFDVDAAKRSKVAQLNTTRQAVQGVGGAVNSGAGSQASTTVKTSTGDVSNSSSGGTNGVRIADPMMANQADRTAIADLTNPLGYGVETQQLYITTGSTFYGVLEIGINSDEPSYVRGRIVQEGALKGAILFGTPKKLNDSVAVEFTNLSLNGIDYSVKMIAIDVDTMRSYLADDVDHHFFERWGGLLVSAFLDGYADTLQDTTTTWDGDRKDETSESITDPQDQVLYAFGKAGEELVPIFRDHFDRESTVTVFQNKEIAFMAVQGFTVNN